MVFCFVVGTDLENAFEFEGYAGMSISKLRDVIYEENKNDFKNFDSNNLNLWKVDIPGDTSDVKMKTLQSRSRDMDKENITIQELGGEELTPFSDFGDIFTYDSKNILIIVQPPPPTTTVSSMHIIPDEVKIEIKNKVVKAFPHINNLSIGQLIDALALIWNVEAVESDLPSSKDDPCVKLRMEPSFFKINLPSTIIEHSRTTVDLCLPAYKSKSGIDYLNPLYDDPQFKDTVSLVQEKLLKYKRDVTVLAGVSGGGKTSTAFGISIQNWSIYVDLSPSGGQYGDFMGWELEKIRARPPMFGQTEEQYKVFEMLDLGIISRGLLLIKMLVQEKISTPKEWLFAQLQIMNIKQITKALKALDADDISSLFDYIIVCLGVKSLILIFDEAQVLCEPGYGKYNGSTSILEKRWNLLQAYIEHLTHLPVTCLISGTYMHMASGISRVTRVGKVQGLHAHIVLKLPFLSRNDVLRNLEAVIDLTDVTSKTRNYLGCVLRGRPRNCASFVRKLISERESTNRTKDQEIRKLLHSWIEEMKLDMAKYLENACKHVGANDLHPEKAIMDILRLRVFYNQKFSHAIKLLQHSIIPCESPKCITLGHNETASDVIKINSSFESYLISGIEEFFLKRGKTLVDIFVDNIILLNNTSSIGNEFDAVFITAIVQKIGRNVREELNKWKNGQQFDLPPWITSTMKFATDTNLSGAVPLAKYVNDDTYRYRAIQPEIYSGSDLVVSLVDDERNAILLSASCTISGSPIKKKKVKEQLIKSCMKFQYMELPRKRKNSEHMEFSPYKKHPCIQIGLGDIPVDNKEDEGDLEEDDLEEDDLEEGDLKEEKYRQGLDFDGVDYDLDYTENTKNYRISNIPERAKNHEEIKTLTENRRHIYVSVELPRRRSKRSRLFRINEYGDLVIIVDDRNMEYVFGPVIKKLMERISENQENLMDETDG